MLTLRVFCHRDGVLKSGTAHARPMKCNRFSTQPVVCRSAMPNGTFIIKQVWIAFVGEATHWTFF